MNFKNFIKSSKVSGTWIDEKDIRLYVRKHTSSKRTDYDISITNMISGPSWERDLKRFLNNNEKKFSIKFDLNNNEELKSFLETRGYLINSENIYDVYALRTIQSDSVQNSTEPHQNKG